MLPGPFALFTPRPLGLGGYMAPPEHGCDSCRWRVDYARDPGCPCSWCDRTNHMWSPDPPPPAAHLRVGDFVRGRNCVGSPFSGHITRIPSSGSVCVAGTITPVRHLDTVERDGVVFTIEGERR